jgi:2-keto-4-pentenoate hydratase
VKVTVDGAIRFEGTASNSAGTDLLRLVTWLANEGSVHTGGLRAGDWITTGSWSGQTPAGEGSTAEVHFSSFGAVIVHFE